MLFQRVVKRIKINKKKDASVTFWQKIIKKLFMYLFTKIKKKLNHSE